MPKKPAPARQHPSIPSEVPILTLGAPVVFPTAVLAIQLTSRAGLAALDRLGEDHDIVGLFYVDDGAVGEAADRLPPIGIAARLVQRLQLAPGQTQAVFHALCRVKLEQILQLSPYPVGRVVAVPASTRRPRPELDALIAESVKTFDRLARVDRHLGPEAAELVKLNVAVGADAFSDLVASLLDIPPDQERELVQVVDPAERLRRLGAAMELMIERVAVAGDVDDAVKANIEEKHRNLLLREQLQAIRHKLGEGRESVRLATGYLTRVDQLPLEPDVRESLRRDCRRLAALPDESQELGLLQGYFEVLLGLPWNARSADVLDVARAEEILGRNHYGVAEIKERILEYLATAKLKGRLGGPLLCLVGPPGTGKTTLARSIADALGRKFVRLSLGGVTDESEIRGHRRTYLGAMPGRLITALERAGVSNPLILLDEIDKLGREARGDPAAALLEILDPEQNRAFVDRYLGVPFDLSDAFFLATANVTSSIPPPLLDRLEVLQIAGYSEAEKVEIAVRHILPKTLAAHGLPASAVRFDRPALGALVRGYTAEAGVRELARKIEAICRKTARSWATGGRAARRRTLRTADLEGYLGPVVYQQEFAGRSPEVGVATGLAWTPIGGVILFIEAVRMPGNGRVEVTGHLGEVMRESVQAALAFVRSRATELAIPLDSLRDSDLHVHFPGGAIPKDGPSAGVAVATCIASLFSGRAVRHDLAMTGEISLRGKVLSVGGILEKVLAAHRAGMRTVVLPAGNRKDLAAVPAEVLADVDVVFAEWVSDVWREALVPLRTARQAGRAAALAGAVGRVAATSSARRSGRAAR